MKLLLTVGFRYYVQLFIESNNLASY